MDVLIVVAFAVAIAFAIVVWQWSRGTSPTLAVLRLLPVGLLMMVAPIGPSAVAMIRGFQNIAESGTGSEQTAVSLCVALLSRLWLGAIALLLALVAAALLHMIATWYDDEAPGDTDSSQSRADWRTWMVVAASVLVVPAALVLYSAHSAATIVMSAAAMAGPPADAAGLSQSIARRLILSTLGGFGLSVILMLAAGVNVVFGRVERVSRALAVYSWAVLAAVGGAVTWQAFRLAADLRAAQALIR